MPARMETYNLLKRFGRGSSLHSRNSWRRLTPRQPRPLQTESIRSIRRHPSSTACLPTTGDLRWPTTTCPRYSGTTRLAGVDVGYPAPADALVDFSTALGPRDKVRGLRLRHFFKEALADFLPPEIIAKKKHGFGLPVGVWLVRDKAFRGLAQLIAGATWPNGG